MHKTVIAAVIALTSTTACAEQPCAKPETAELRARADLLGQRVEMLQSEIDLISREIVADPYAAEDLRPRQFELMREARDLIEQRQPMLRQLAGDYEAEVQCGFERFRASERARMGAQE